MTMCWTFNSKSFAPASGGAQSSLSAASAVEDNNDRTDMVAGTRGGVLAGENSDLKSEVQSLQSQVKRLEGLLTSNQSHVDQLVQELRSEMNQKTQETSSNLMAKFHSELDAFKGATTMEEILTRVSELDEEMGEWTEDFNDGLEQQRNDTSMAVGEGGGGSDDELEYDSDIMDDELSAIKIFTDDNVKEEEEEEESQDS